MTRSETLLRNGVHPRRLVELFMGEPPAEKGSGRLVAQWGRKPPERSGYIDTRLPRGKTVREAHFDMGDGRKVGVWFPFEARGPRVTLLYSLKHPSQKPMVKELSARAAKIMAGPLRVLRPKPTLILAMPSKSWMAQHFAQELGRQSSLPVKTDLLQKVGEIKGTFWARKLEWARRSMRLSTREGIEGQSIILADDNVGSGASMVACAELLYAAGAAYVHGAAIFRITGKKEFSEPDVEMPFARSFDPNRSPEPQDAQPDETEGETENRHGYRSALANKADYMRDELSEDFDAYREYTLDELCQLFEVNKIEMRFALSQMGLLDQIKPG